MPWQAGYRLQPQNEPYLPVRFTVSEPHTHSPATSSVALSPDKSHQAYLTADLTGSKYPQEHDGVQCQISNLSLLRPDPSEPERCLSVSPGSRAGSSICLATHYSKAIFPTS